MDNIRRESNGAADGLFTARRQLQIERTALATCEANGWAFDAATARHEIARLERLIETVNRVS